MREPGLEWAGGRGSRRMLAAWCNGAELQVTAAGMAGAGGEFVEGWLVAQVLGEGAYGEVRLLVHARSGARVALKAVGGGGGAGGGGGGAGGAREAALHGALRHRHVLRCLGARAHGALHYLFLEYAPGGELFERIEPDVGMPAAAARRYWRQLALGLRYLHARGVAHRDIKPENLLLDARDELKISDFGLATLFRHGARERRLSRVCGTLPYAAPEVHAAAARPYRAAPADTWAAGVVLLAMLAGELPWERAQPDEPRYASWAAAAERGEAGAGALWARVGGARGWLARALQPRPERRAALADLLLDPWMHAAPPPQAGERGCLSQPAGEGGGAGAGAGDEADGADGPAGGTELGAAEMDALLSASQPAAADDLLLSSQLSPLALHSHAGNTPPWGVARRLARVWVRGEEGAALRAVAAALEGARCSVRRLPPRAPRALLARAPRGLALRATAAVSRGGATLVHFQRWRGCGLSFQRLFLAIRDELAPLLVPEPPGAPSPAPTPMDEDT